MNNHMRATAFIAIILTAVLVTACQRKGLEQTANHSKEPSMSNVIHITTPAFEKVKAQSKPVLIDFWAPWCGPCRLQGPILDQVSLQVGDKAIVGKVNVDEERDLASKFGVQAIPTLVIMKDGKVVRRFVGVQQVENLVVSLQAAGQ